LSRNSAYPFSALVGQDALTAALLLNAVDPLIGGVLIRGQKGTGKSTSARALSRLLPEIEAVEGCPFQSDPRAPWAAPEREAGTDVPAQPRSTVRRPTPFVELPLNATEDRLAGTLHLEQALQTGKRQFDPGLLAAANRGILYVDEVNLLDDHLVDLLLDAAASGVNRVEREGLSFTHPARFMLIGTMNPEEGELRPQFLDRFGLCVTVDRITNLADREAIVRRRLAFDRDPESFIREWADADLGLTQQVLLARARLSQVRLPDHLLTLVTQLTHTLETAGHRADITTIKAALAHAAFLEKEAVELEDIVTAARLALSHRMPASPLDSPEQLQQRIDRVFRQLAEGGLDTEDLDGDTSPEAVPSAEEELEEMARGMQVPGNCAAGNVMRAFIKKKTVKPSSIPTSA
jgi:Mg-chelatase subunit ChlI